MVNTAPKPSTAQGAGKRNRPASRMHASTTAALREYSRLRNRRWPALETPAFFVSRLGVRLTTSAVNYTFPKLIREVGLEGRGERLRPRPHDLRHTFAVRTLLEWHRVGAAVERELPRLSTYLGHYAGDRVK